MPSKGLILGNPWSGAGWKRTAKYRDYVERSKRMSALQQQRGRLTRMSPGLRGALANYMQTGQEFTMRPGGSSSGQGRGSSLADQYEQAQDEANEANERRYKEILGGYRDRYDSGMSYLKGQGERERSDITRQYDEAGGAQHSDLVSRGLSASTVGTPMQRQIALGRADALGGLNERLQNRYTDLEGRLSKEALDFAERREDEGPNLQDMLSLYNQAGKGGVGRSGRGGRGGGGGVPGGMSVAAYEAKYGRGGFQNQYAAALNRGRWTGGRGQGRRRQGRGKGFVFGGTGFRAAQNNAAMDQFPRPGGGAQGGDQPKAPSWGSGAGPMY